jgi:predicted aconitase with swiveling domain
MSRALLAGAASGPALVLSEPLSMWGGLDAETGRIIDRRHPEADRSMTGAVLVLRWGRGSSSASAVLAESIRRRTGPAAIVMVSPDEILLVGALVAEEMYEITCPIIVIDEEEFAGIATGDRIDIRPDGALSVTRHAGGAR